MVANAEEPDPFFVEVHVAKPAEGSTVPYGSLTLDFSVVPNVQETTDTCQIQDGQYPFDEFPHVGAVVWSEPHCDPDSPPTVPTLPAGKYTLIIQTDVPAHVNPGIVVKFSVAPPVTVAPKVDPPPTVGKGEEPVSHPKAATCDGALVTVCDTRCYVVKLNEKVRHVRKKELTPEQRGFKGLASAFFYRLYLKGAYEEGALIAGAPVMLRNFTPSRWALIGASVAEATAHPKRELLASTGHITVESSKVVTSYGLSANLKGPSFGISFSNHEHVAELTNEVKDTTGKKGLKSFVLGTGNPLTGPAGPGSGMKKVTVQSSVTAHVGSGPFNTAPASWSLRDDYDPGGRTFEKKVSCKGIRFDN